jgi:hypothetical protein
MTIVMTNLWLMLRVLSTKFEHLAHAIPSILGADIHQIQHITA